MTRRLILRQFGSALQGIVWRFWAAGKSFVTAVAVTSVLIALIAYCFGVWRFGGLDKPLFTTTINASTESLSFRTPGERESAWSLPPGEFSVLGTSDSPLCNSNDFESVCRFSSNTRLVVDGSADILMQMSPEGGWLLSVAETDDSQAKIALYDAQGGQLLASNQLLEFHTANPVTAIRIPFVADAAVLGADLHQSATIDGTAYDFWQPSLLSGDVLMIANNRPSRETYKILEERLDSGDVISVGGQEEEISKMGQNPLWGMVTVIDGDDTSSIGTTIFHVVMHTSVREVSVRRFGAPDGHIIRASDWTILQKWPNGQSAWVFFVSLVLVLTFVLELSGAFVARPSDTQGAEEEK